MSLKRFQEIHGVQAGSVKARKPHIADDNEFRRVIRVLKFCPGSSSWGLVPNVRLLGLVICRAACHDHFYFAFQVIIVMPFRSKGYDFIIEVNTDLPVHTGYYALSIHCVKPFLEMRDNASCKLF